MKKKKKKSEIKISFLEKCIEQLLSFVPSPSHAGDVNGEGYEVLGEFNPGIFSKKVSTKTSFLRISTS